MDNEQGDSYSQAVAAILRRHYEQSDISYTKIASRTGLGRATVVRVINGEREATAFYLHKLCEVFNVTPGSVLDEADNLG